MQKISEIEAVYRILNNNFRYKCECGHTVYLINKNKDICTHCGKWVFKSKIDEFKYRLNLTLSK